MRPLRSNTAAPKGDSEKRLLALCMVFGKDEPEKDFGQVWRDRLRLQALEKMGYEVYSCDMSHDPKIAVDDRHLQANFDNAPRFKKALLEKWGLDFVFGTVCFDYFYIPTEWASTRFGSGSLMKETIPWLMDECRVKELWLPNHPVIRELLEAAEEALKQESLRVEYVSDPMRNPLYRATEEVDQIFKNSLKEVKTNKNQMNKYVDKRHPFIRLW